MRQKQDVFDIRQSSGSLISFEVGPAAGDRLSKRTTGARSTSPGQGRLSPANGSFHQAASVMAAITSATVSPNEDGVGTMVTPALFRISTFS